MADDGNWWYCLTHHDVEHGPGCPNAERLGPYQSRAEAEGASARAAARTKAWDDDPRWNDEPRTSRPAAGRENPGAVNPPQ